MPDPQWHHTYTQEMWQQNYDAAMAALHQNHNDPEAMAALRESTAALNAYDKEGVEQTKLSDIPHELGTVAHGLVDEAKGIPAGLGKLVHDVREGQFNQVGSDVIGGVKQMGSNILAPADVALHELTNAATKGDPTVSPDELNSGLAKGGAALTDIAATRAPSVIKRSAGSFSGAPAAGSTLGALGKMAQFVPGPIGKVARGMKSVGELPTNISENYALKNALMKARLEQMGQSITKTGATMDDVVKQSKLKTGTMEQNLNRGSGSLDATTKRPGLQNDLTELQIEKMRRGLEGDEEAGPSGSAPVEPKPPTSGPNDILSQKSPEQLNREQIQKDAIDNDDPYGLNSLSKATPPTDPLGKFINLMKMNEVKGEAPHDILSDKSGTKPLTPEQINQLLNGLK